VTIQTIKMAPSGNHSRPARRNAVSGCPLTAALAAMGGKWKLIIIYWLAESPKHFAAIRRAMPGISQKVLTQQLRELESDEIVRRRVTGGPPTPVYYSLTDYGRSLLPLLENIRLWGRNHIERFSDETASASHRIRVTASRHAVQAPR
jgi:DNA-binding HxlR family transcriptional regulator